MYIERHILKGRITRLHGKEVWLFLEKALLHSDIPFEILLTVLSPFSSLSFVALESLTGGCFPLTKLMWLLLLPSVSPVFLSLEWQSQPLNTPMWALADAWKTLLVKFLGRGYKLLNHAWSLYRTMVFSLYSSKPSAFFEPALGTGRKPPSLWGPGLPSPSPSTRVSPFFSD